MNPHDLTGRDLDLALHAVIGFDPDHTDGGATAVLFAEIAAHTNDGTIELIRMPGGDFYSAKCFFGGATGSTPNEALARLLLMVAGVP